MDQSIANNSTGSSLVWLVTGTSSGLGRELVHAALDAGQRVIATSRTLESIEDIVPSSEDAKERLHLLKLDVTAPFLELRTVAAEAYNKWGRIDVVVNNAGAGMPGLVEEVGAEGFQKQFDLNFFGALNVTYAFLPYMRAQRSGTVVFINSRSSWKTNVTMYGPYAASKAALSAMCDVLAEEVKDLGIRVLNVLPGGLRTANWDKMVLLPTSPMAVLPLPHTKGGNTADSANDNAADAVADAVDAAEPKLMTGDADPVPAHAQHIADYAELRAARVAWALKQSGVQPGCPKKSACVIVDVVCGKDEDKDASRGWPDLNMLVLGSDAEANIREKCERVVKSLDVWQDVVRGIDLPVE